jgi:sugar phosphate isomerase/epimerase
MKLSISNIAWDAKDDNAIYGLMNKYGFTGLEIAPTRIFPTAPYNQLEGVAKWLENLKSEYGFTIPSMQSIWFGRSENIFASIDERESLDDYTRQAIDFASVIKCGNLVFGCPKNRNIPDGADTQVAVDFFKTLGDYAFSKGTVIGMEANPTIYNTNFINDTKSAIELIGKVCSNGFKLNFDMGTVIQNNEMLDDLIGNVNLINHVHISEPGLKPIETRAIHIELRRILEAENYNGYISIEMGRTDCASIEKTMSYIREIFG